MSIKYKIRFIKDYFSFKKSGGEISSLYPIYSDYKEQAGSATGHYFHQDLYVANCIYKNNPKTHIDVGSRIDGFVAHVASFRAIEIIDVRALRDTGHNNISFKKLDLSQPLAEDGLCDSISCLHAIEHFGLGRYGDSIDPDGHKKGFINLLKMLKTNGILYISFPIANKTRLEFNAHRVFHPKDVFNWQSDIQLELQDFSFVDDQGDFHPNISVDFDCSAVNYGCGIYQFRKNG